MVTAIPKVFISYSWAMSERVLELAERLVRDGVDVVIDKWNLKEGQDKYAFMEQSVTDEGIGRVLLICDRTYAEKADARTGGVGSETVIISPSVYEKVNQEKFIPVIFEVDESGHPYLPTYIRARIYFDLSDDDKYESEYEKLLRNLYDKPLYKKPSLGKMPGWLEDDGINLSEIHDMIKQIKRFSGENGAKSDFLMRNTKSLFISALKELNAVGIDADHLLGKIDALKPLRDLFVEFVDALIYSGLPISEPITSFFELVYNATHDADGKGASSESDFECYNYFIWETFIDTTATLLYYEKYDVINKILSHTYFLRESTFNAYNVKERKYCVFQKYMRSIEGVCKLKSSNPNLFTLSSEILVSREKKPILTRESISGADVLLYQLFRIIHPNSTDSNFWFPDSYIYYSGGYSMWSRLKSREYCEKVLPLFGASSIENLKSIVSQWAETRNVRHNRCFDSAPSIFDSIQVSQIGSIN